ncbi:hypothetical protein M413DRAFT_446186 [Hebeloma cylindrosporum]|uniref:Uncharacterized protein n=1 Tax=Hebeloma cylindrosporum TaxID=76867 RepID=A0A0C3BTP7_HEBCY|nr:hypothetical protein M413DRAFT_446186 [Hebeloma cylindrosporum h7]
MEQQAGDEYIRQLASFIRSNERALAESGLARRRNHQRAWFSPKPLVFPIDTHHLFYVLIRLEALGFDTGSLDVQVQSPSRPMSYANIYSDRKDPDAMSLADSLRSSFSMVSRISLATTWWPRPELPNLDLSLKYIYSSFTKLPALSISPPGHKAITELLSDPPDRNAVPLDVFKNLQRLECDNIDPRTLLGWDRLAESLKSLKIRKSGLQDISVIFSTSVLDDQARRQASSSKQSVAHNSPIPHLHSQSTSDDLQSTLLVPESSDTLSQVLSPSKWAFLKHLYLPDNGLTFFPPELLPYLTSLTHLDLSSNLLVSVPALGELYNLRTLNLADNLIDSVLGIYLNLGQIIALYLSSNRLESLCGLERLLALERVDLRNNLLEECSEIGRLAALPNLSQLWIEGNPFVEIEDGYRVTCFNYFWKDGKFISIDGTHPTMYERRSLASPIEEGASHPTPTSSFTPIIGIETFLPEVLPHAASYPSSTSTSVGGQRHRKVKRIVELDDNLAPPTASPQSGPHSRFGSTREPEVDPILPPSPVQKDYPNVAVPETLSPHVPLSQQRHTRHQTEYRASPLVSLSHFPQTSDRLPFTSAAGHQFSASYSSKSEARRARVSASVFEPSTLKFESEDHNAEAYRKKIESLKEDMGESWLKVYSQSQSRSS